RHQRPQGDRAGEDEEPESERGSPSCFIRPIHGSEDERHTHRHAAHHVRQGEEQDDFCDEHDRPPHTESEAKTVRPPSTGRQTPVTKPLSRKNSTAWAMFSGLPSRFTSVASMAWRRSASDRSGGSSTGPGRMQLTRTAGFRLPSSTARVRVSVGIAPFEGKYAA